MKEEGKGHNMAFTKPSWCKSQWCSTEAGLAKGRPTSSASTATQSPANVYNTDENANLREAVFKGNEQNTAAIEGFEGIGRDLTGSFLSGSQGITGDTTNKYNTAYNNYNNQMSGYLANMGTADQDIHTATRGQAYAGLDSGFANANDELQASLARRGLSSSGIGAKSMGDLSQARMSAGAAAGVNAHSTAIGQSDARRNTRMAGAGNLYNANLGNIGQGYSLGMGQLNQDYSTQMGLEGQIMQNQINNNQQRQANLMGYAQLGRGLSGMSANYLSGAGTGFGNVAQMSGNTALGMGQLNNSYNSTMQSANASYNNTMQQANSAANAQSANTKGTGIGAIGSIGSSFLGGF